MDGKEIILRGWSILALLFVFLLTIAFTAMSGLTFWMDAQNAKETIDQLKPNETGSIESFNLASQYTMKKKAYKKTIFIGALNCLCMGFLTYFYIRHKQGYRLTVVAQHFRAEKNNARG